MDWLRPDVLLPYCAKPSPKPAGQRVYSAGPPGVLRVVVHTKVGNVSPSETSSQNSKGKVGFVTAPVVLLVLAVVLGWWLAASIGYRLAFLPALGCLLGAAVAAIISRHPRKVFISSLVGLAGGVLVIPAYLGLLAPTWQ